MSDGLVHSEACWSWGQHHYGCALAEVGRLRSEIDRLRAERDRVRNALARVHYDLSAADALLMADLKSIPPAHSQD